MTVKIRNVGAFRNRGGAVHISGNVDADIDGVLAVECGGDAVHVEGANADEPRPSKRRWVGKLLTSVAGEAIGAAAAKFIGG